MPKPSPTPFTAIRGNTKRGEYIRIAAANHVTIAEVLRYDSDHDYNATAKFIVRACNAYENLRKLRTVLQDELDALRIWREARPLNADVREGVEISISKISTATAGVPRAAITPAFMMKDSSISMG